MEIIKLIEITDISRYNKMKEDRKLLHKEFYVVAKLMKLK